jgi:hypothetical protein
MKRWMRFAGMVGCFLAVVVAVVVIAMLRSARAQLRDYEFQRRVVCLSMKWKLEGAVQDPHKMTTHQVRYLFLDQQILNYCVGDPLPVSSDDAEACWIFGPGDGDRCYDDVARKLLEIYQQRWPNALR